MVTSVTVFFFFFLLNHLCALSWGISLLAKCGLKGMWGSKEQIGYCTFNSIPRNCISSEFKNASIKVCWGAVLYLYEGRLLFQGMFKRRFDSFKSVIRSHLKIIINKLTRLFKDLCCEKQWAVRVVDDPWSRLMDES